MEERINLPKPVFTLLKEKSINRDEYLLLTMKSLSGNWPDRQTAIHQLKMVNSSYYRALRKSKVIWGEL